MSKLHPDNKISIISAIIGVAIGGLFFYFFRAALWTWFNVACSLIIAFLSWGSLTLIISNPIVPQERYNGIGLVIFTIVIIFCLHSCFYISPEEKEAKIKEKEITKQLREEAEKADQERAKKLEEEENAKFASSGENVMVFGPAGNESWALTRAKSALKRFAKNPDSIKDVTALTQPVRVRIKQYPQCRYALQVQYTAQNSFGATGRHTGVVLFNSEWYGFAVLEQSPF